jgi:hypothetical protein
MSDQPITYKYHYSMEITMSSEESSGFTQHFSFSSDVLAHPLMDYDKFNDLVQDQVSEVGMDIDDDGGADLEIEGIDLHQIAVSVSLL